MRQVSVYDYVTTREAVKRHFKSQHWAVECIKREMRVEFAAVWVLVLLSSEKCCFGHKHSSINTGYCSEVLFLCFIK